MQRSIVVNKNLKVNFSCKIRQAYIQGQSRGGTREIGPRMVQGCCGDISTMTEEINFSPENIFA